MKTVIVVIIIAILIIIGFVFLRGYEASEVTTPTPIENKGVAMCYYDSTKTTSGFWDRTWIRMDIDGGKVTGEFYTLPAEKDSKVGTFEGTVGPMIPEISARIAEVWWKAQGEGMEVTEELRIEFGEGTAVAFFGEMKDRGDGVYEYANKDAITPGGQLGQIDCESLEEIKTVEKYIRENIKTIATNDEVLGGTWHVLAVNVVPSVNQGEVVYEDGHIQSKASFTYTFDSNNKTTNMVSFEVKS